MILPGVSDLLVILAVVGLCVALFVILLAVAYAKRDVEIHITLIEFYQ
jgi:hypothetical protein